MLLLLQPRMVVVVVLLVVMVPLVSMVMMRMVRLKVLLMGRLSMPWIAWWHMMDMMLGLGE